MSQTAAFLQNVRQRPHDDGPRLVFADWLEEHGDPRSEFIRLQCLRAGFTLGDSRKAPLLEREQALLQRHGDRWVGPLLQRGIGWEFRRGLLYLRVDAATFLQTDWEELTQTETWEWVETTAIRLTRWGEPLAREWALGESGVRRQGEIQALAESPSLALLEALDLKDNGLGDGGVATLAASPHVARLRSLDLGFNQIGPEGAARLATSANLAGLTTLKLDDNRLGDLGTGALAQIPSHQLRLLGFDNPAVLAAEPCLPQLATLMLRWNDVGVRGARALAVSQRLPRLATLHLGNNDIGDAGAEALAAAPELPQLTELYLEYNGVGAAGAAALRRRFGDGVRL